MKIVYAVPIEDIIRAHLNRLFRPSSLFFFCTFFQTFSICAKGRHMHIKLKTEIRATDSTFDILKIPQRVGIF